MRHLSIKKTAAALLLTVLMMIIAALPTLASEAEKAAPEEEAPVAAAEEAEAAPEEEPEAAPEEEPEAAPEAEPVAAPAADAQSSYTLATPDITLSNVSSGMKVSWGKVSGASHYRVLRKVGNGSWITQTVTTKAYYTDASCSSGTVYRYKVRCCDADGNYMSPNADGKLMLRLKAPSSVSVSNAEYGVKIGFGNPRGTLYFELSRKTGENGSWTSIGSKIRSNPVIDTNVVTGESYLYRVRAFGSFTDETGKTVNIHSVWATLAEPITRLVSPEVTAKNKTTGVGLEWDAVPGAEKYAVLRKTATGSWIKKAVVSSCTWTDSALISGNTYQYKVRCVDASGEEYQSANPTEVTTHTFMRAPKITSSENTAEGLHIDWDGVSGAAQYIVYRKTETGASWYKQATVTESEYVDTKAKSGHSYYYTVRSVNAAGVQSARYTNVELRTYIGMPTPISAVNGPEGVTFTWEAPEGAEYFRVLRKYTDNGAWTKKEVVHGTSFTDVNVISGVAYHYTVRPVDPSGENYIGPRDGVGVRTFFLRQPKLKSAESADGGVLVKYSTVSGADRYDILRSEAGGEFAFVGSAPSGTGHYLDTTAVFETGYVYTVMAVSETENASSSSDTAGVSVYFEDISKLMFVAKPSLSLYSDYTSTSSVSATAKYMDKLIYLETAKEYASGSWIKVDFNGSEYYFWQPAGAEYTVHHHSGFNYTGSTQIERDMIALAMDMYTWPIRYRHGESNGIPAEDGTYGFDCSGFAAYVLKNVMQQYVPTYWVTTTIGVLYQAETIYNKGIDGEFSASDVDIEDLRPGDILFFKTIDEADPSDLEADVTHCGIYMGNNEFIHCTHYNYDPDANGLFIMPLGYQYTETLVAIRRYVPESVTPADITMYVATKADIREAMASDSAVIDSLGADAPVTVRFTNVDRTTGEPNWAYVEYGEGKAGFVQLKYLTASISNEDQPRWVAVTSLRLYEQATTSSDYIEVLITTEVSFNGRCGNTNYYKVTYNGQQRYVYVKDGADVDAMLTVDLDTLLAGAGTRVVTKSTYLRSNMDSSTNDSVIRLLQKDEVVTLIAVSSSGTWSYVRTSDGVYGFALSSNLTPES